MRRGEHELRPTPEYIGARYGEGYLRKPEVAKPAVAKLERAAEQPKLPDLTSPEVMAHLEALVDAQRRQRELQDQLKALDTGTGAKPSQELRRKVLAAQWKAAEEALHVTAERASQALGLGTAVGRRMEPAEIPAPPMPKVDLRRVPAPPGVRRKGPPRPEQEQVAA